MIIVRGAVLWLGPAILASLVCTAVWHLMAGGEFADWRPALFVALVTLMFTVGGSAFLSLVFSSISPLHIGVRYLVIIVIGMATGGMLMLLSQMQPLMAGVIYGGVTACLWVSFHRLFFGRSEGNDRKQESGATA